MTSNADKESLKDRIKQSRVHAKIKEFVLTTATLMAVCTGAQAQTKEKQQKDDKEGVKTEVNVGFSNISALNFQRVNTTENNYFAQDHFSQATQVSKETYYPMEFYNDLMPTFNASIEKNGFYGKVSASQLIILKNADLSTLNNKMLFELGKEFGNGSKVFMKAGREATEVGANFFNGVVGPSIAYETDSKNISTFGNLSERAVLGVEKNGDFIELGIVGKNGDGLFVIPNPKQADFWGKVCKNFEADGLKIFLSAATQLGHNHKVFASAGMSSPLGQGKMGVMLGGNYDFDMKEINMFTRAVYNSAKGMDYIVEAAAKGSTFSISLGVGKNGVQGFVKYENGTTHNVKDEQTLSETKTGKIGFGVSYSFGGSRKL